MSRDDEIPGYAMATMGGTFLRFVTPSDTKALKDRVDGYVRMVDAGVAASTKVPPATRLGWTAFSDGWRKYFKAENTWWGSGAEMDQGEVYEKGVAEWQKSLAPYIGATGPNLNSLAGAGEDWTKVLKYVAVAGGVVAVAVIVKELVGVVKTVGPKP